MRAAKVQASLRIRAVSPEPPLLAHTRSESRGTLRQKARSLAQLNGWACAVEICHDGMLEDTNSLDGAQTGIKLIKLFSLANETVPSFDFEKDDCAVGSAVLGKRGYNLNSTQLMVLFHVKDRKRSSGFFDGVRNAAGCIYYSRKRVSDYCIFNF